MENLDFYCVNFNVAIVRVGICSSSVKEKSGSHVMRIKPEFIDHNGQTFWKLESYKDEYVVLSQGNFQTPHA